MIAELCFELGRIKDRFGDLETRTAGGAVITKIAVVPAETVDEKQPVGRLVVTLLTRENDAPTRSH